MQCASMLTDAVAQLQNESCPLVGNVGMAECDADWLVNLWLKLGLNHHFNLMGH